MQLMYEALFSTQGRLHTRVANVVIPCFIHMLHNSILKDKFHKTSFEAQIQD
jgi:hypothetical protein